MGHEEPAAVKPETPKPAASQARPPQAAGTGAVPQVARRRTTASRGSAPNDALAGQLRRAVLQRDLAVRQHNLDCFAKYSEDAAAKGTPLEGAADIVAKRFSKAGFKTPNTMLDALVKTKFDESKIGECSGAAAKGQAEQEHGELSRFLKAWIAARTDPRLTWNDEAKAEGNKLDNKPLPWNVPGNAEMKWNGMSILENLSQVDESTPGFTREKRCGANAVLALAIIAGPRITSYFARRVMLKALGRKDDKGETAEDRKTMGDAYNGIWPSIVAIERGNATYGHLSWIAHFAKVVMSKEPAGATTGHEVAKMAAWLDLEPSGAPIEDAAQLKSLFAGLKPGQAWILNIDSTIGNPDRRSRSIDMINHYVVLGKDANGTAFLYDPFPRVGSQVLRSGQFDPYFKSDEGIWKSVYIFARPKFGT